MSAATTQPVTGPFLIVNPKAHLGGSETLRLALLTDELAARFDIDVLFTAQHVDLRMVAGRTGRLCVTAQHMDPITPGRGMGRILPESLVEAGARAVVLNHAEHPLPLAVLDATMERARQVGLATVVCADTDAQCRAVAAMGPDVMICEPTASIGTGRMDAGDYVERTTRIVKDADPGILVIQAAGVTGAADIARVLDQGADGSGGTSGIVKHPDWRRVLTEMFTALAAHRDALP
ncbi:triose-phosphate isomerase [Propionibacterium acidifaciens]|uniref:Triose-phosphate isomerase-like protein n=1 Tax=Propionibacterium acidifaciens F0233 TaxID=553198 RepID=U2S7E4_9ACTN|nr:triose-phosphate isomerase [Propionibacterium acidifaciens]AYW77460.1 triose-phosphate isomerase [Propionibacterium acidifaciens]ERK58742.1 triose-phosphate isomerase-like protein [Propionibacterium acidifaciens F0233]